MNRKGIILSGGSGTRLYPLTMVVSKQLLPVYDKPMIYYPLSTLMSMEINEILIITTPAEINRFKSLLGDGVTGEYLYLTLHRINQTYRRGIYSWQRFHWKRSFSINFRRQYFHGHDLAKRLKTVAMDKDFSTIVACNVKNPELYGIVEIDKNNHIIGIEEKASETKIKFCVTGMYFYDNDVIKIASKLKPLIEAN